MRKEIMSKPIVNDSRDLEKVDVIKQHFSNEVPVKKQKSSTTVTSKPEVQPQVVYDNSSSIPNKPTIAATKSKPFKIKENAKKSSNDERNVPLLSPKNGSEASKLSTEGVTKQPIVQREYNGSRIEAQNDQIGIDKFDENEVRVLSNTQSFNRNREGIDSGVNKNVRRSMNNLNRKDRSSSRESSREIVLRSVSKQSQHKTSKQRTKPPLNNSSSQSSLSKLSAVDTSNLKSGVASQMSSFAHEPSKRHETLNVEKQTTKPLMKKVNNHDEVSSNIEKPAEHSIIKPNLTQSVAQSKDTFHHRSKIEEEKHPATKIHSNPVKIEKKQSSSEDENQVENDDVEEESEEEDLPVALNQLVFSFLPQQVAAGLNDQQDWKKRTVAIQTMESLIKKELANPNEDFPIYITDICMKMCKMMHDSNFKISLTALRILFAVCTKYGQEAQSCIDNLVSSLCEKLSDNKIVIRHAVLKVFYALSTSIGAKNIVARVFPYLDNENWHIREEILSILIMS